MTAFSLSKYEKNRRAELAEKLGNIGAKLSTAIDAYNTAINAAREALEEKVDVYNEALALARQFCEDIASQAEEDIGEKTDRWRESEDGDNAEAFKEAYSEWAGSSSDVEFEYAEPIDETDPLESLAPLDELPDNKDSL